MSWFSIHGIKAVFILAMIFVNWAALVIWLSGLHVAAFINQLNTGMRSSYWLFLAEDHMVNVIMSGHFLTTVSSEIGNLHRNGSRSGAKVASVVNYLFWKSTGDEIQKNHCINAIEATDKHVFKARRAILGTALFQATNVFILYGIINTYIM
jgi:hypothetical protein